MMINLKSRLLIIGTALLTMMLFVGELEARRGGGGGMRGGGMKGGGGFSRGGAASRGSFSGRSTKSASRPTTRPSTSRPDRSASRQSNAGDRQSNRQDNAGDRQGNRDASREDRQDAARDRQDDRQDFVEDELDDRWDHRGGAFVAGAVVGAAASNNTYITTLPCSATAIPFNGVSYYNCSSVWYERVYSGGNVTYVVTTAPPGH